MGRDHQPSSDNSGRYPLLNFKSVVATLAQYVSLLKQLWSKGIDSQIGTCLMIGAMFTSVFTCEDNLSALARFLCISAFLGAAFGVQHRMNVFWLRTKPIYIFVTVALCCVVRACLHQFQESMLFIAEHLWHLIGQLLALIGDRAETPYAIYIFQTCVITWCCSTTLKFNRHGPLFRINIAKTTLTWVVLLSVAVCCSNGNALEGCKGGAPKYSGCFKRGEKSEWLTCFVICRPDELGEFMPMCHDMCLDFLHEFGELLLNKTPAVATTVAFGSTSIIHANIKLETEMFSRRTLLLIVIVLCLIIVFLFSINVWQCCMLRKKSKMLTPSISFTADLPTNLPRTKVPKMAGTPKTENGEAIAQPTDNLTEDEAVTQAGDPHEGDVLLPDKGKKFDEEAQIDSLDYPKKDINYDVDETATKLKDYE